MRTLRIRMTTDWDSRGNRLTKVYMEYGRYNGEGVYIMLVYDQSISLYLPAEIIDDIVSQMSISML